MTHPISLYLLGLLMFIKAFSCQNQMRLEESADTIHLIKAQTSYAAHGDDLKHDRMLNIIADPDSCDYKNDSRTCQLVLVIGQTGNGMSNPIFPFLVNYAPVDDFSITRESNSSCGEQVIYTLRTRQLPLNITLSLSETWLGFVASNPEIHFVFLVYSEASYIETANFHAMPVFAEPCTYFYANSLKRIFQFHHFIARQGEQIFTERLLITNCDEVPKHPPDGTMMMFLAGSMSAEIENVWRNNWIAYAEPYYPMVGVNWRMPVVSTRGDLYPNTCIRITNRLLRADDAKNTYSNETWMSWSENNYNFPTSSKIAFNGSRSRDLTSFKQLPSRLFLTISHLTGGTFTLQIMIPHRSSWTTMIFRSPITWQCSYEAYAIQYFWTPNSNSRDRSTFSVEFVEVFPNWDPKGLCTDPVTTSRRITTSRSKANTTWTTARIFLNSTAMTRIYTQATTQKRATEQNSSPDYWILALALPVTLFITLGIVLLYFVGRSRKRKLDATPQQTFIRMEASRNLSPFGSTRVTNDYLASPAAISYIEDGESDIRRYSWESV